MFVQRAQIPANQAAEIELPPVVRRALEENAQQLSPIGMTSTTRMASRLSPADTLERLKLTGSIRPNRFFVEYEGRVVWQDQKIYASRKFLSGDVGDRETTSLSELTFDGHVISIGSVFSPSKEARTQPRRTGVAADSVQRHLIKQPMAKTPQRQPIAISAENPYLGPAVGLLLTTNPRGTAAGGGATDQKPHVDSAVLNCLENGWTLISVEITLLEGHRHVRVELEGDNTIRSGTFGYDLENRRKMLARNLETNTKQAQSGRLSLQHKAMVLRMQQQQEEMMRRIEERRKLPATRRYVFYLDPDLHYAVRRFEQSYGPDTLLTRSNCSQFEQIPGRQLWLPRRVETELHEYNSVPETVFKEAFLFQVINVLAFDGGRVPDQTFALNYTEPGTIVSDRTDPAAANSRDRQISYMVPARLEDLPGVIERARRGENMVQIGGGLPFAAEPRVAGPRNGALMTIVLSNMVVLGAGAAYVVWRRKRGESV
jgi:hypothetical protein